MNSTNEPSWKHNVRERANFYTGPWHFLPHFHLGFRFALEESLVVSPKEPAPESSLDGWTRTT